MNHQSLRERIWYESSVPIFIEKVLLPLGAVTLAYVIWTNPMQFDGQQRVSLGVAVLLFLYFLAHTLHLRNEAIRTGSVVPQNPSKEQGIKSAEVPPSSPTSTLKPTPVPVPAIPAEKNAKKPELTLPHIDRSIKVGDGAQVTSSPMTTGDNSPITVNPEFNPNAPIITYEFNGVRHEQQDRKSVV